jgi:ABC-type phosphate/phosphonate transport system substrate-binding protein
MEMRYLLEIQNTKCKMQKNNWQYNGAVLLSFFCFLLCICGCGNLPQERYGQEAVKLAVLPVYSAAAMSESFIPLLDKLSLETGFDVQFISSENVGSFCATVKNSETHLVICNILTYLSFRKTINAKILAVGENIDGSNLVSGLIIIPADDNTIKGIGDLRGKKICCASRQITEGYLSQAGLLQENGIDLDHDVKIVSVGHMDGVLKSMGSGKFDACFITELMWNRNTSQKYKVLAKGLPVPCWILVSLQGGTTEIDQKIREAITALNLNKLQDHKILDNIGVGRFVSDKTIDLPAWEKLADLLKIPY